MSSKIKDKEIQITIKDLIVSATDKKGIITYTNEIFCKVAGYEKDELIGQPHNIIRHPDMPKAVFKLLWDTVLSGQAIYAFVKNKSKNGDYYWVKAYVKPIIKDGEIVQIISYRKPVNDYAKEFISGLYAKVLEYEKKHTVDESLAFILDYLGKRNLTYTQFIDRLSLQKSVINPKALSIDLGKLKNAHLLFKQHIVTDIKEGNVEGVEVVGSCCCEFGKWLKTIEEESFAQTDSWKEVIKYHNHIHEKMQDYVDMAKGDSTHEQMDAILGAVESDVEKMFNNVVYTVDNCKE